MERSFN